MNNHLLKLLVSNKSKGSFSAEVSEDQASIYLYDAIVSDDFFGGVSAESFVKELNAIKAPVINLRINSPGGDVFAARAIETAIRQHGSQIHVHIDGLAASAASYIAIAGDKVSISEGGFLMIHKAWTVAFGNSYDLVETATLLEKIDNSLVKTYADRTGKDVGEISDWMDNETWFSAQEALDNGFVDEIDSSVKAKANWDLSVYQKAPIVEEQPEEPQVKQDNKQMLRIAALARHF